MDKALWDSDRAAGKVNTRRGLDWRRKMSDHIAYALLAYTGLQIWVTMGALKSAMSSILPYLALIVLVAAIIPGCRMFEKRWEDLSDSEAADPALAHRFKRDRALVWAAAITLPLLLTGLFKGIASFI
ncbi:MAG TPA: hypothetical protein VLA37_11410 [Sphingomonadaceae bacterium]|nr:hypothetical protein [Sphingomonadaceae bacterium]